MNKKVGMRLFQLHLIRHELHTPKKYIIHEVWNHKVMFFIYVLNIRLVRGKYYCKGIGGSNWGYAHGGWGRVWCVN